MNIRGISTFPCPRGSDIHQWNGLAQGANRKNKYNTKTFAISMSSVYTGEMTLLWDLLHVDLVNPGCLPCFMIRQSRQRSDTAHKNVTLVNSFKPPYRGHPVLHRTFPVMSHKRPNDDQFRDVHLFRSMDVMFGPHNELELVEQSQQHGLRVRCLLGEASNSTLMPWHSPLVRGFG